MLLPSVRHTAPSWLVLFALAPVLHACDGKSESEPQRSQVGGFEVTATDVPIEDDGQWLRPAKDYASTRFTALNQITAANVGQLRLAWSFSTGVQTSQPKDNTADEGDG